MKKIVSTLLAIIFLLSQLAIVCFAEDPEPTLENIATNGLAYCSSMKHSNWTPPNTINDGKSNDWPGWEPAYPSVPPTENTSKGFNGEYCGIKFLNNEYYEVHKINMVIGLHAQYRQNVTYTIKALVEGVWETIATVKDEQFKPNNYDSYEDAMENDTSNYHIRAEHSIDLDEPVNTNNVRIIVDGFAKNYPGGDVLIFPYIYEVELIGKRGETPDLSLPEGAEFSSNAAHNSIPYASSSKELAYPFLAIDKNEATSWKPGKLDAGQFLMLELEKEYTVDKITLNFGSTATPAQKANNAPFKLEAMVNGNWQKIADGSTYNEATNSCISEFAIATPIKTNKVRVVFEQALKSAPSVYEFEVNIVGERTYYLQTKFTAFQKQSSAKGNLAILGTAYASANLLPYSEPSFINDGRILKTSSVWFGGTIDIPVSCGVKLDKAYTINKVAVYCAEPSSIGTDVTSFNIIAKVDGKDQIVATGKSYDPNNIVENSESRYTTIYTLDGGVTTDDIRIEFTRGGSTIPNVLELEIYSDTTFPSAFDGYPTELIAPTYTAVENNNSEPNTNTGNDKNEDNNSLPIIIGVSAVMVVAVGCSVGAIIIINRKKKNPSISKPSTEDANASNDEENKQ